MPFEWKLNQTKPGGNFFADLWNFDQSRYWRSTAASWTNNKYMTMMMAVFLSLPIFTQHLGAALRDFPGHSRELGERQDSNDCRGSRRLGRPILLPDLRHRGQDRQARGGPEVQGNLSPCLGFQPGPVLVKKIHFSGVTLL